MLELQEKIPPKGGKMMNLPAQIGNIDEVSALEALRAGRAEEEILLKENSVTPSPDKERGQLKLLPVGELLSAEPPEYLIDNTIEVGSFGVLYGDPGTYKSFLALDWGLSVATGLWWNGRETRKGPVVCFIGEGHRGYGRRIKAWSSGRNRYVPDEPFFVSNCPAQMLDASFVDQAKNVITELEQQHGTVALVIFDTVARSFGPGDENSTKDMSQFISAIDNIFHPDTTKLLVHHTGHGDQGRARGSSALKAACDHEFSMSKKGDLVVLSCTKSKDSEAMKPIAFEPEIVDIGAPGVSVTSLYLKPVDKTAVQDQVKLSPQMRQAINLLQLMNRKSGISCISDWMNICRDEEVYTKSSFYNAIKTMEEKKVITITGDYVKQY
jgi:hypothetical protein